jgi:hypothetical protein
MRRIEHMPAKSEKGKGGIWDTRPNPFTQQKAAHIAPELAAVSSLGLTLDRVLRTGCAVMLGHTRDGGAVVLTVLDGEQRHRTYCANESELDAAIEAMSFVYSED